MNKIIRLALAGAAALALTGAASASTNLVDNGDFEASSKTLVDWTKTGLVGVRTTKSTGNDYAAFAGFGSLSQTLETVAGDDYTLTFDLASISALQVFVVSYDKTTIYSSISAGLHAGSYTFDFTGDTDGTLKFTFLGAGAAALDNVSVVDVTPATPTAAVPEPAPASLLFAGAALLALAALRRRQAR